MKARIAKMLTEGIDIDMIAGAYGVSAEYLREQIESDEDLKACLQEAANEAVSKESLIRNEYDALESELLEAIKVGMVEAEFRDLPKALEVLNKMNPRLKAEELAREKEREQAKATAKRLAVIEAREAEIEREERMAASAAAGAAAGAAVTLSLPSFVAKNVQIETNARSEITEIEGRKLSPLSYEGFQNMLEKPKEVPSTNEQGGES